MGEAPALIRKQITLDRRSIGYSLAFGLYGLFLAIVMWAMESAWFSVLSTSSSATWLFWQGITGRPLLIVQIDIVLWTLAILPGIFYAAAFFRKKDLAGQSIEYVTLGLVIGASYSIVFYFGRYAYENLSYIASGNWWRATGYEFLRNMSGVMAHDALQIAIWVIVGALVCYAVTRLGLVRWEKPALRNAAIVMLMLVALVAIIPLALAKLTG